VKTLQSSATLANSSAPGCRQSSLDEIAREVGVSRFYFLRLFKASTGLSPHAYLMMRRLELAKHLIQQGKTLAQAAYDAGFADQSHLTRHFNSCVWIYPRSISTRHSSITIMPGSFSGVSENSRNTLLYGNFQKTVRSIA
jgi:AraC-like DNA-binding protein